MTKQSVQALLEDIRLVSGKFQASCRLSTMPNLTNQSTLTALRLLISHVSFQ